MDMEFIFGLMAVSSKVIGKKIKSQAMEYIPGKMAEFMKATGNRIICMVKDIINGLTAENMKDSIMMIRKKDLECIHILMEDVIKVCGQMVNSMVKELS